MWRQRVQRELHRLRHDGRPALLWSLRITAAAVASYVVATLIFPDTEPLLAPLTAMLVVQVTPVSLLASGLDRVLAVVTGVFLAVGFAAVVPLEWWSLGLLIFVAIMAGHVLRLRDNLIEVAISGMLVLGVGSLGADAAAWERIAETLVGAAVGIATNLLVPPKIASADAARAIDALADHLGGLLDRAARELDDLVGEGRELAPAAQDWLDEARGITHEEIPRAGSALAHAEQGRRLNVRAVATPDVGPGLRQGFEALEHSAVSIRSLFRALVDASNEPGWLGDDAADDVLLGLAQTLRELAAGVDAFGQLVRNEAVPLAQRTSTNIHALRDAIDGLREAQARLDDLATMDAAPPVRELLAAVALTVKRLLREMDLEQRVRLQVQMRRLPRVRSRPVPPPSGGGQEMPPDAETVPLPRLDGKRGQDRERPGP
jgi:hypothetical protein